MENKQQKKRSSKRGTRQEPHQQQQPQPLKVVYISNPMKLNTSASNFRSIVQELTGQHAVWPVDPSKYSSSSSPQPPPPPAEADLSTASTSHHIIANGTADPSTDVYQPLDQDAYADDRVVLIDHHMLHYMLHDHQDFAPQSDSRNKF